MSVTMDMEDSRVDKLRDYEVKDVFVRMNLSHVGFSGESQPKCNLQYRLKKYNVANLPAAVSIIYGMDSEQYKTVRGLRKHEIVDTMFQEMVRDREETTKIELAKWSIKQALKCTSPRSEVALSRVNKWSES